MSQYTIFPVSSLNQVQIKELESLLDEGVVWDIEQSNKFLHDENNILLLASSDNTIVGYLIGYLLQFLDKRKSEVLLYEIAVAGKYQ